MHTLILIGVVIFTILLVKHAYKEGIKIERNNLIKNLEKYEQKEREKQNQISNFKRNKSYRQKV